MIKHFCDLCGKVMVLHGDGEEYRIQRKGVTNLYVTLDAHDECIKRLLDKKKEGEVEDGWIDD